jgi:UDP-N-acetylmuramyl pentapeptide phosphotransferase/UDP-N-acetylglucosamine-1-phosphate transferase
VGSVSIAFILLFLIGRLIIETEDFRWIVIALIVCTGIINAYNFMDGINGITGGYSLVILAALAYINKEVVTFVEADFIYTVICSVLVFCFFNFRKRAKCFAGDVGSVSIAFILLFLIGRLIIETEDFSWIVLLSVYGVEQVQSLNIKVCKIPLISNTLHEKYQRAQKPLGNGRFLMTCSNTKTKKRDIERIAKALGIQVTAEIV